MNTTTAYIALGANLGKRRETIERAILFLNESEGVAVERCSCIIETEPMGDSAQPRYLNAAIQVKTSLSARSLLDRCLEIEQQLGRDRSNSVRWGPRAIDLDMLLFGNQIIDTPGLRVPHPHLHERDFVLQPLSEIAGELVHPVLNLSINALRRQHRSHTQPTADFRS